jgi:methyl-accepting chemotaxis protein
MDAQVEEMVQAIRFFKTADHQRENVMLSRSSPQGAALMRAKDAHAKFLNRMQAMYRGAIPVQKLSDHHSCAFGQWFDEQGREMLEETGVATKIDELHAQFHGFGNQMIASLEQGDREAAGAALVSARGLSEVLIELFDQTARSFAMPSHQTKASLKPLKASMPAKSQAASAKASSAKSAKAEKKTPAAAKDEWDEF